MEKDIWIILNSELNTELIREKVSKANQMMDIIRNSFTHLDTENFKRLFKDMVYPDLKYGNAT